MCLIVFSYNSHPRYQLILGANRDEYRSRPTAPAGYWQDAPGVLAGRDLEAGGTWLGVSTVGRFAAVTNYRDPRQAAGTFPSRGRLVADFLTGSEESLAAFHSRLAGESDRYDGFNLLYGDHESLHYHTNRGGSSGPVSPGIHALSNHLLDSRWPKSNCARQRLAELTAANQIDQDALFRALADPAPFADGLLPDTGIGLERERLLSPIFITGTEYGTRSTTLLLIEHTGLITFRERCFDADHRITSDNSYSFTSNPS